ncbi:MAG TPA: hypothetical protein VFO91_02160 [Anaerolineales bacterium]|nr:hypothetical protein [Anaerolineales bacterium]
MNVDKDVLDTKWDEFRRKVLNRRNRRRNDQLIKANSARERSIRILQQRYGYTREKATYQLDKHYSRAWLG